MANIIFEDGRAIARFAFWVLAGGTAVGCGVYAALAMTRPAYFELKNPTLSIPALASGEERPDSAHPPGAGMVFSNQAQPSPTPPADPATPPPSPSKEPAVAQLELPAPAYLVPARRRATPAPPPPSAAAPFYPYRQNPNRPTYLAVSPVSSELPPIYFMLPYRVVPGNRVRVAPPYAANVPIRPTPPPASANRSGVAFYFGR